MVQKRLSHIRDRDLQNRLLEEGLLSQQQIQAVLLAQYQQYQKSQEALRGLLYQINLKTHQLLVKQSIELNLVNTIELSQIAGNVQEWPYWGKQLLLLDSESPRLLDTQNWLPGDTMGLVLSEFGPYLYLNDLGAQAYLIHARQLLNPHYAQAVETGPYDVFVDPKQKLLCVLDRAPGDLWLINPDTYETQDIFTLRQQTGQKALLLEPDPRNHRILFIDQVQHGFSVLDYKEGMLQEYPLGDALPVHLSLFEDRLYFLVQKPQAEIICLDALKYQELFRIALPGTLYIDHQDCPANPFALSPDGKWLAVLCGQSQDLQIHWLNTQSLEFEASHSLTDSLQPAQLVFASPNPLQMHRRRLSQLLLDEQLIDENTLLQLFPDPNAPMASQIEVIGPDTPMSKPTLIPEAIKPEPSPENTEAALLYLSPIERFTSLPEAHRSEYLPLDESIVDDILHILSGSFYQQSGVDLERHPEALEKLRQYATQARIKLQDFDILPVEIPHLLEHLNLKTLLLRESILALRELHQAPVQQAYETPPTHCPECKSPVLGGWDCATCGMELLNSERAHKRSIASVLPHTWLPAGYFAIPDVQSGRLLLVNTHRYNYVTWQIDFKYLPGAKQPWDMLWLQDLSILIADRGNGRVLICNHAGRIKWEFNPKKRPELMLNKPVKATCYHQGKQMRYLIVDQGNHRILEVDDNNELTWQYGHSGLAGESKQMLKLPNDIQFTHEESYLISDTGNHRVLEIKNNRVIRVFGSENKLINPVFAERLFNGNTLIVDAGNTRVIEIDPDGHIQKEVFYYREGMDERFHMTMPLKMVRRENQNIVLIDANRVMEIDPMLKKIVWFSFLHELKLDIELPTRLRQPEIKREISSSYETFQLETQTPEHMSTLRRTLEHVELFHDQSPAFFEDLEKLLTFRRYQPGEIILRKNHLAHSFFILQSGIAEELAPRDEKPYLLLEPGDAFGFMGIIYREARKTSIRAQSECGVYTLEKRDFDQLIKAYPEVEARVKKLAQERLVMARVKQTPKSEQAAARLKNLIATQKERANVRLGQKPTLEREIKEKSDWNLTYSEIEQHLIQSGFTEGLQCLEICIQLKRNTRMRPARVALIVSLLEADGTLIKTLPAAEQIMEDQFDHQVVLSYLTKKDPKQLREDLIAVSDVLNVEIKVVKSDS